MIRAVLLSVLFVFACGGARSTADAPGVFDPVGLRLVIGVDRTKTIEVQRDGSVVSSETGHTTMKFTGQSLQLADGSRTILELQGDELVGPSQKHVGTIQRDELALGGASIRVDDDGVVKLSHDGADKKMRMHFDGSTAGHKRPALMLVAVVFALYVATNPHATIDRFLDD